MKTQIVERVLDSGETEYGVQYYDGHTKWFESLAHAKYEFDKHIAKKNNRNKAC